MEFHFFHTWPSLEVVWGGGVSQKERSIFVDEKKTSRFSGSGSGGSVFEGRSDNERADTSERERGSGKCCVAKTCIGVAVLSPGSGQPRAKRPATVCAVT